MISNFKKNTNRGFIFIALILVIVSVIIVFLIVSNIKLGQKRAQINLQIAAIQRQMEELRIKNEDLKDTASKVGSPEYLEKIAREQLNLQKENEKVIAFVMPKENEVVQEERKGNWLINAWEWIKGRF